VTTDIGLLERISALDPKRREAFMRLLKERQPKGVELRPSVRRRRDGAAFPLSFAQQRLWLIDQLEPGTSRYNVPESIRLRGHLDAEALSASLNTVVRRHEVLRTRFTLEGETPRQCVEAELDVRVRHDDVSASPEAGRLAEAERLAIDDASRPFDLGQLPLLRALLVRLAPDDFIFVLTFHHIVYDGWSRNVLVRELVENYEGHKTGRPIERPPLTVQYADFAVWQAEMLQGAVLAGHVDYWRSALAGASPTLALPTDRPPPRTPSFSGGQHTLLVPAEVRRAFESVCKEEAATPFMGMLAAFALLLHRYSGQDDVVVGVPFAGRARPEQEEMIGFFVNVLPLRMSLGAPGERASFRDLLRQARRVTVDATNHSDLPFDRLVSELRLERVVGRNPLFQVSLHYGTEPVIPFRGEALSAEGLDLDWGTTAFDLSLYAREHGDGIALTFVFSHDLFDRATVERFASHMGVLLRAVAAKPNARADDHLLHSAAGRTALIARGVAPSAAVTERCLHREIEERAASHPDAVALACEGDVLSYAELNRQSNVLAHRLVAAGVGPGSLVGLCLEPSLALPVAIVAIMKAGGAYVPLDPGYPPERLALVLGDAEIGALVTRSALRSMFFSYAGRVVCVDQEQGVPNDENPETDVSPKDLAYVIYTSGSTGKPKGVLVTHQNVQGLFAGTRATFRFGADDVWTLFHSYSFDFSVWEMWGAFLHGGRLVIVPRATIRSPEAFYALLSRERVTILNQTPAAFQQLIRVDGACTDRVDLALRWICLGGDSLDVHALRPWFERHGGECPRFANLYGPTEITVLATIRIVSPSDLELRPGSLLGQPICGDEVHVLDARREPVPVGVRGEIYVGGAGLARGYLNRPELTAERFVLHPFSETGDRRLYRTGDMARYRSDGELEFLGRADDQVKLRGVRIELGEIEATLSRHAAVSEAAVVVHSYAVDDQRLVAFVALRPTGSPVAADETLDALRDWTKAQLPAAMVPSLFIAERALPLTPNGKLDRRALHVKAATAAPRVRGPSLPSTPTEARLLPIWAEVLKTSHIGVDDDFFASGGHSLLGVALVQRVRREFDCTLPLASLFEAPTVAQMAVLLEAVSVRATPAKIVVPIRKLGKGVPLFLVHPAGGHAMAYHPLATALAHDAPLYALQSRALEGEAEHESIAAMCRAYADAIQEQCPRGPYRLAGWSMGGALALGVAALLRERNHEVQCVALFDTYLFDAQAEPFDLDEELDSLSGGELVSSHRRLLSGYEPPAIDAPVWVWWANERIGTRRRTDWRRYARAHLIERELDGHHYSIMKPPHVEQIGRELGALLDSLDEDAARAIRPK
jgi:amino acid adenylation domain-containing protein